MIKSKSEALITISHMVGQCVIEHKINGEKVVILKSGGLRNILCELEEFIVKIPESVIDEYVKKNA